MESLYWKGPISAEPDFNNVLAALRREKPSRPTLAELFMNEPLYRRVISEEQSAMIDTAPVHHQTLLAIQAFRNMGYDYATVHACDLIFETGDRRHDKTLSLNDGALVTDRESFERYNWPTVSDYSFDRLEAIDPHLPDGMKVITIGPGGVLENAINVTGYDNLCIMIHDDPDLADEIFAAVGTRLVEYYKTAVEYDSVGAIWANDDWGFKTQTMLSPEDMRRYPIPWHAKIAATAHEKGKPVIMHSCGELREVYDDIVNVIHHDGKHSYEDTIMPVEEIYELYHDRFCVVGGIDVDFVCRSSPDEVYDRAISMIERTKDRGGYMLGTGNSVPTYVPDENFFALIAAAWSYRDGNEAPRRSGA